VRISPSGGRREARGIGFSGNGPIQPSARRLGALTNGAGIDGRASGTWPAFDGRAGGSGLASFAGLAGFAAFAGLAALAGFFAGAFFGAGFLTIFFGFLVGFCFAAFAFLLANAVSFGRLEGGGTAGNGAA
jgi:hypothetical protein